MYVNWTIQNKHKVNYLNIVLSDHLNRFYVGESAALLWSEEWKKENKKYLDKLYQEKIPFKLTHWQSLTNSEHYKSYKKRVDDLYRDSQEFKIIVDGLATSHQNKAGFNQAVQYLLEESAVIASLPSGILTYPAQELNGAIHCTLKDLNCGPTYIGYMFTYSKSRYNAEYNLFSSTYKTMCALEQASYKKDQDKKDFLITATEVHGSLKDKSDFTLFSEVLTNSLKKRSSYNQNEAIKENPSLTCASSSH